MKTAAAIAELIANRVAPARWIEPDRKLVLLSREQFLSHLAAAASLGIDTGASGAIASATRESEPSLAADVCPACETTTCWCSYCGESCATGCAGHDHDYVPRSTSSAAPAEPSTRASSPETPLSGQEFARGSAGASGEATAYSFCESVWAGPIPRWHIRPLTSVGRKLGGGIDTAGLCGRPEPRKGWDLSDEIAESHLTHACHRCVVLYRAAVSTGEVARDDSSAIRAAVEFAASYPGRVR